MSLLVTKSFSNDPTQRTCTPPSFVDDPRFPPESLGYAFIVHGHPYDSPLSEQDVRVAVEMAVLHGTQFETARGEMPLSVIAFFSNSIEPDPPTCDGFYQYFPGTLEFKKWSHDNGVWTEKLVGRARWTGPGQFTIDPP